MAFTGEVVYGWRIAKMVDGRRPIHGTGVAAWVDEVVVELVKGQRHIRAKGEQGIDPHIVLARAITAGLADDLRDATERKEIEEVVRIQADLISHERVRKIRENGWAAQRVLAKGAVFHVGTAAATIKRIQGE